MFSYICFVLMLAPTVFMQRFVGNSCTLRNGQQNGLCTPARECTSEIEAYNKYGIRPSICGYQDNQWVYCCDISNMQNNPHRSRITHPVTNTYNTFQSSNIRVSERKCDIYIKPVTKESSYVSLGIDSGTSVNRLPNCPHVGRPLIFGGVPAKRGEYPHMAAIGWELNGRRGYLWKCGGTLISEKFVLTAAHCLYLNGEEYANDGEPAVVRLGTIDLYSNTDGINAQVINIRTQIVHPDYRWSQKYHDIGLLQLARPARLGQYVRPACLWTKSNINVKSATATGWGLTTHDPSSFSNTLLLVNLNIVSRERCSQIFRITNRFSRGIIDSQFCAGVAEGGKDTCGGDSGGPLQVQSESNPCIFHIIGLTSFGPKVCGNANSGGVYTKISSYIDWIEKNVWTNE